MHGVRSLLALFCITMVRPSTAFRRVGSPLGPLLRARRKAASLRPRIANGGRPPATVAFETSSDSDTDSKLAPSAGASAEAAQEPPVVGGSPGPSAILVVSFLILIKSSTDIVTNYVARPPAAAMALAAELMVFPVIISWIMGRNLQRRLKGTAKREEFKEYTVRKVFNQARKDDPMRLGVIGLVYALDNLVYFYALSNLGAATYCVLAQTKIFFTAFFLRLRGLARKFSRQQILGLTSLFCGAVMVSLRDVASGVAAAGGNKALGVLAVLIGQASSAYANVAYEESLKRGNSNMWVRNVQLTAAISFWLLLSNMARHAFGGAAMLDGAGMAEIAEGFSRKGVQLVVLLKALSAIAIAATFKYGGNILYASSKPWPVMLAAVAAWLMTGAAPPALFVVGVLASVGGMFLYYSAK